MTDTNYSLESESTDKKLALPDYDYHPRLPKSYRPKIGLIGCGGIAVQHLTAYKNAGLEVVALCDLNREAAEARRAEFFPEAEVFTDPAALLALADVEVVDAALHIAVETRDGAASLDVEGSWFPDGFAGTMGELLCAIEEDREPENNAADNLRSLELVFAAMAAARESEAVKSGALT